MDKNQRHFPRLAYQAEVEVEFIKWNDVGLKRGSHILKARTQDLSVAGLGLVDLPPVEAGILKKLINGDDKLRLTFHLPGGDEPLTVFARMLWRGQFDRHPESPHRCGCLFIDLDTDRIGHIDRYLTAQGLPGFL